MRPNNLFGKIKKVGDKITIKSNFYYKIKL